MEYFEIKNRVYLSIRRGLGIFMIVIAVVWFITYIDSAKIIYLLSSIFFVFYGIYQLTNGFGLENSWFRTGENFIIIKWANKIIPVRIHDTRIAKISLERMNVIIYQKDKKPLKLQIDYLEREDKKEVYEFLIKYSKQRNIVLEKHFGTLL